MVEAAECGQKEVLEFLVEKGADVNGTHFSFRPLKEQLRLAIMNVLMCYYKQELM